MAIKAVIALTLSVAAMVVVIVAMATDNWVQIVSNKCIFNFSSIVFYPRRSGSKRNLRNFEDIRKFRQWETLRNIFAGINK